MVGNRDGVMSAVFAGPEVELGNYVLTCIPAVAVHVAPTASRDIAILRRLGFRGSGTILLCYLASGRAFTDPFDWGDRTMQTAHRHVESHWQNLRSGDVVDVEHILGETDTPKASELLDGRAHNSGGGRR